MRVFSRCGDFVVEAVEHPSRRVALLFGIFLVFGFIDFAIWAAISALELPVVHGIADGLIHGGLAVVAAWLLLKAARERRQRIRMEVEQSARLNHEIRNALEVIGQAGYLLNDVVYGRAVAESTERIRKTLNHSKLR